MSMAEEGGTLQKAVVLKRKAMVGITIAYGQQQHRPDQLSPPTDPNGASEMEINALRPAFVTSIIVHLLVVRVLCLMLLTGASATFAFALTFLLVILLAAIRLTAFPTASATALAPSFARIDSVTQLGPRQDDDNIWPYAHSTCFSGR